MWSLMFIDARVWLLGGMSSTSLCVRARHDVLCRRVGSYITLTYVWIIGRRKDGCLVVIRCDELLYDRENGGPVVDEWRYSL